MYIPHAFRETDPSRLHNLIRANSFGTLVSTTPQGPVATHLPMVLDLDRGPHGTLLTHLAKPNDHWKHLTQGIECLAIFQGPHAYISPLWYTVTKAVPTWNYTAVHVYGTCTLLHDPPQILPLLRRTVEEYEHGPTAWKMDDLPQDFLEAMAKGVVGVEIQITRIEGKSKVSQNRSQADQQSVIAALNASPNPTDQAVAALMQTHVDHP